MPARTLFSTVLGGGANPAVGGTYPLFPDGSADFRAGGTLALASGGGILPVSSRGWSVAWWMKQDAARIGGQSYHVWGEDHLFTGAHGAGDRADHRFNNGTGVYQTFMSADDGTFSSTGDVGDPSAAWIFVVSVYDPSTFPPHPTMRGWTNDIGPGSSTSATALMQPAVPGTAFQIATGPASAGFFNWNLGRIDAMSIWGGALVQADVDKLWNGGLGVNLPRLLSSPLSQPLIAWWPFDEPSGSAIWRDASGNGNHLLATGTVNHGGKRGT